MSGLLAGVQLGPYRLDSRIGAGGMGEVYRGTDTRLGRQVAIKILPPEWASDSERRARFEREAHAIAALNHPHICTIHDVGRERGVDYMVMELIEGQTLADRIGRQPLALDRALAYAIAIADALDAAHRHGIVHRDLKPSNVMIVKAKSGAASGQAKLLDFGLAQFPATAAGAAKEVTATGVIVGTPQYMAPEQINGHAADARTDVFAFGALLHEMLAGRPPFEGSGSPALMAAILHREPPPIENVPPALAWIVTTCLAKAPDDRFSSMHDVLLQLRRIAVEPHTLAAGSATGVRKTARIALAALVVIVAGAALAYIATHQITNGPVQAITFTIDPPPGSRFPRGTVQMAVAPGGDRIVFVANAADGTPQLWLRRFDSAEPQVLEGTAGALAPFWSPDGRFIGFYSDSKLKRIAGSGGPAQVLSDVATPRGAAWGGDGTILFVREGRIHRVSENGGESTPVTPENPARATRPQGWPVLLPNGRTFLYVVREGSDHVVYQAVLDGTTPPRRVFVTNSNVIASGSSIFSISKRSLVAQAYDPGKGELTGQPVTVASPLAFDTPARSGGAFAVGADGTIAYRSATPDSRLAWFTRTGVRTDAFSETADYHNPSLAPDDNRLAIEKTDPATAVHTIWILDLARGTTSRLVYDEAGAHEPLFSPDGRRVVFSSGRRAGLDLYWIAADGSGHDEPVGDPKSRNEHVATDWSRDGRFLALRSRTGKGALRILPIEPFRPASVFFASAANVPAGTFSQNEHWLAYSSDETGTSQVYVRRFPQADRQWQVSTRGGFEPRWSPDGKELFYLGMDGKMMAAPVRANDDTLQTGPSTALFDTGLRSASSGDRSYYCVTADGRFLVNLNVEEDASAPITVLLNWKPPAR